MGTSPCQLAGKKRASVSGSGRPCEEPRAPSTGLNDLSRSRREGRVADASHQQREGRVKIQFIYTRLQHMRGEEERR